MSDESATTPFALPAAHVAAVNRSRRIIVNNDVGHGHPMGLESGHVTPDQWVAARFSLFDEPGSQVDCVSWCLDEGNRACYPSKVLATWYGGMRRAFTSPRGDVR